MLRKNTKLSVNSSFSLWMSTEETPTTSSWEMWLSCRTDLVKLIVQEKTQLSQTLHSLSREEQQGRVLREFYRLHWTVLRLFWNGVGQNWLIRWIVVTVWCCPGTHGTEWVAVKQSELEQLGCVPSVGVPFSRWLYPPSQEVVLGPSTVWHRGLDWVSVLRSFCVNCLGFRDGLERDNLVHIQWKFYSSLTISIRLKHLLQ